MVARLQYFRFCLFEMYVNVVFVIRCHKMFVQRVKEQRFIIVILLLSANFAASTAIAWLRGEL